MLTLPYNHPEGGAKQSMLNFGAITVDAVSDGYLDLNLGRFFPSLPREAWAAYPHGVIGDTLRCALTTYLVRTAGRTVLVDTGLGPRPGRFAGESGSLIASLLYAGVRLEDVDAVVFTHLHIDHVGWNCIEVSPGDYRPTFPNAQYVVNRAEWERWEGDGAGYLARNVRPLAEMGQLVLVDDGHEPAPGVRLLSTPGHTAGHVSILVYGGGEGGVITGDAAHHPAELEHTDWSPAIDEDPALSARSRETLVQRIEADGLIVLGGHFPPPHAGRMMRVAQRRIYQPLPG